MDFVALIPARYQSSRFPGKPLKKIDQHTVLLYTYHQVLKSTFLSVKNTFIVTDDDRIQQEVVNWKVGAQIIRVDDDCVNGTERITLALEKDPLREKIGLNTLIVNVQGDEPLIDPGNIDFLLEKSLVNYPDFEIVTLYQNHNSSETSSEASSETSSKESDPNCCKLVTGMNNKVLYGSRSAIPFSKNSEPGPDKHHLKEHIGVFVYRREWLQTLLNSKDTPLQLREDIEWLKTLELDGKILAYPAPYQCYLGVNTPDDLIKIQSILASDYNVLTKSCD